MCEDLGIKSVIENTHRIGGPTISAVNVWRSIIVKFLYRPERFHVIQKNRSVKNGARVSDNLIWEH